MKILQIGSDNMPSNSANNKQIQSMRRGFLDLGHDVLLLSFRSTIRPNRRRADINVKSIYVGKPGRVSNFLKRLLLKVICWAYRPDFVYTRIPAYASIGAAQRQSVIVEVHETLTEREIGMLVESGVRKMVILTPSTIMREHTSKLEIRLLPQGFDKKPFDYYQKLKNDVEHPSVQFSTYALYFGAISFDRGVGLLIECAKRLPHIEFVFAGRLVDGFSWPQPLPENVKHLGYLTPKEYIPWLMNAAVHVLPYSAALPHAKNISSLRLYELLYSGRKILVSDILGMRLNPMLRDNPSIFVEADSVESWCRRIDEAVRDKNGNPELKDLVNEYTWERRCLEILDFATSST